MATAELILASSSYRDTKIGRGVSAVGFRLMKAAKSMHPYKMLRGFLSVLYLPPSREKCLMRACTTRIYHMHKFRFLFSTYFALMLLGTIGCVAQMSTSGTFADTHNAAGPPDPGKETQIWKVDPITGSVSITIPFLHVQPSVRAPFYQYSLQYNSSATFSLSSSIVPPDWTNNFSSASTINGYDVYQWMPPNINDGGPPPYGISPAPWTEVGSPTLRYSNTPANYTPSGQNPVSCNILGPMILTDDTGSHDLNIGGAFGGQGISGGPCASGWVPASQTTDGSTLQTSWVGDAIAIYPDGSKYLQTGLLKDANGNFIASGVGASGTVTDSLGRPLYSVTESTSVAGRSFPYPTSITTYTNGSQEASYTLTWSNKQYNFTFPQPTTTNITTLDAGTPAEVYVSPRSGQVTVLSSITLAGSSWSYTFDYDSIYGTIKEITFPTGGHVRFVWKIRTIGDVSPVAQSGMSSLAVSDVYVSNGSGEDHWTYSCPDLNISTGLMGCTVTDPQRNSTAYTGAPFATNQDGLTANASPAFHEILRQVTDASKGLIRTVNTTYGETYGAQALPSTVTTTLKDAVSGAGNQQQTKYIYDKYNNVIEKDESDFYPCSVGVCAPPAWLRKTLTEYYWKHFPDYEAAHIVDKPYTVTVEDGFGNPLSKTQYDYDQFALTGSKGIQNHDDDNYPATVQGLRGNKTTESRCIEFSAGNCVKWATTKYRYDLTGQVASLTDPCFNSPCSDMDPTLGANHTTVYSYDDDYTDASPAKPTNGFVTKVTRPQTGSTNHIDAYSYYFNSGDVSTHTGENGETTSYSYGSDVFNRIGQVTLPATADGPSGTTSSGYTQYSYSDLPDAVSVTQTSLLTANGPKKLTRVTNYDSLGRVTNVTTTDPEGDIKVDTSYDSDGRIYSVSNPYRSVTDPTYGITVYNSYDALGRKNLQTNPDGTTRTWGYAGNVVTLIDENRNQWKQAMDGLGRPSYVLEPNGAVRTSSLQTNYSYDALGNLIAVTQCGGACPSASSVNRNFSYDGLSRLVQSFNPESGWTCYGSTGAAAPNGRNCTSGYDANGNLSFKTDARAVVTTYSYDGLNRILSKSFTNDASSTPSSCYTYDSSSVSNSRGRMTSEWTERAVSGACSPGNYLSKLAITSYDAMGRILSEQQSTLASQASGGGTTYYPLAYTYDLAGNIYTSTNGSSSKPISFTNEFDTVGRLRTLTSSWTNNGAYPAQLFAARDAMGGVLCSNSSTKSYSPFGALMNAQLGGSLTLNRAYDKRLQTACEIDMGTGITPATPGSVSLTITGSEQNK
jgi:YD repeat-containing protein